MLNRKVRDKETREQSIVLLVLHDRTITQHRYFGEFGMRRSIRFTFHSVYPLIEAIVSNRVVNGVA